MNWKLLIPIGLILIAFVSFPTFSPAQSFKYPPCYTIRESKLRGCYLYGVTFEPNVIAWKGKEIKIKEAWFEQAHERLLIGSKRASHYNLCVTLSAGWDVLRDITATPPFFVVEGTGKGFGMMGSAVLWERFDRIESEEFNVLLTDNWKFDGAIKIKLKATKPGSAQKTAGHVAFFEFKAPSAPAAAAFCVRMPNARLSHEDFSPTSIRHESMAHTGRGVGAIDKGL
jgi:hypothetical protein